MNHECDNCKEIGIHNLSGKKDVHWWTEAIDENGFFESFGVVLAENVASVQAMRLRYTCELCDSEGSFLILQR